MACNEGVGWHGVRFRAWDGMQFICASCDDAVDCRYAMLPASCSCTLMPSCVLVARMPIFVCMVVHVLCTGCACVVHVFCVCCACVVQ
jgi:hypothetical protein